MDDLNDFEELEEMDELDELEAINGRLREMDIDELQRVAQQTKREYGIAGKKLRKLVDGLPTSIPRGLPEGDAYHELLQRLFAHTQSSKNTGSS